MLVECLEYKDLMIALQDDLEDERREIACLKDANEILRGRECDLAEYLSRCGTECRYIVSNLGRVV